MAKARLSEGEALEKLRREREVGGGVIIDMRIDVEFNDETIVSVGGRWDRRLEDFDPSIEIDDVSIGDPDGCEGSVVVYPHAGQIPAVMWFASWLAVHAGRRGHPPAFDPDDVEVSVDPAEVFSAMLAGGRRGGKTWIGALFCAMYAVMFPGAIVWVINPNANKHDEVRRYMSRIIAPEWVLRETQADGWELVNGSAIMLKSAYVGADPDAIKEGEANFIWMNEGQKMAERVYVVARGAISDHSGIVLVCANPPVETKDQQWVADFAADATALKRASHYIHINPLDNPNINRAALLAMKREIDERAFRIEVLGEFLGPADAVAYNWVRTPGGNEAPMPGPDHPLWRDVTAEFLELVEEGEGITDLVGMDVQVHPHIGGPVYRFYGPHDKAPNRDNVVAWIVDELVLEGGDEVDWCGLARDREYDPQTTLIVCDGTGEYQHSRRRSVDSPPSSWKGKGSFDLIRGEGYRHIVPPSRRFKNKNPDIIDRVRAFTSMIANTVQRRRLFCDRDRAPMTCKAIRQWATVHGKPSRSQEEAHLGDAASYPMVRVFPRILRSDKPGQVDPLTKRFDRTDQRPPGFGAPKHEPRVRPERRGRRDRGL